jgi:asparagine synthase (glutamine-hydrolysing)
LDVALGAFAREGESALARLEGDFAFLVWDRLLLRVIAVRDSLGVRRLFVRENANSLLFSSSLNCLGAAETVDEDYVAAYLCCNSQDDRSRSIWSGCHAVRPGTWMTATCDRRAEHRYWYPRLTLSRRPVDDRELQERFLGLLHDAVRHNIRNAGTVWAELSGGLDTSSIVAIVEDLRHSGVAASQLGGSYTIVDEMGGGDERVFSHALLERYPIRNEEIWNYHPWQDDGAPPPLTEEPRFYYPFWARDRKANRIAHEAGADVILSGGGADYYLAGNALFIADLLASMRVATAIREAYFIAITRRCAIWRALWDGGIAPLLPAAVRGRFGSKPKRNPPWVTPGLRQRLASLQEAPDDSIHHTQDEFRRFWKKTLGALRAVPDSLELELGSESIPKRYPFLNRRLVEFALTLPPRMINRNGGTKWIEREAMVGLLPDLIRHRTTKGWGDARVCWALSHEFRRLDRLLRDPLISQAGWVDRQELRRAFESARAGATVGTRYLMASLSLETWLAVRFDRFSENRAA